MDPVSMAAVSIGASAGSGILGAFGNRSASKAKAAAAQQEARANYQQNMYLAQVARNNKALAEKNSAIAKAEGGFSASMQSMATRSRLGKARVAQAASGLDVNSGTNVAVQDSIEDLGQLDADIILYKAGKEAFNWQNRAQDFEAEATLAEMKASNALAAGSIGARAAMTSGDYGVATSLLGGATSVSDKWMSYKNVGVF